MCRCSIQIRLRDSRFSPLSILFFIAFLISVSSTTADEVKITRVLDSNLFELKDGRRVRLAHVLSPSVSDSNRRMAALALQIKKYAEQQFVGEVVRIEFPVERQPDSEPLPVHIFQKFPLKTVWYNKVYLERGFGKFIEEADTTHRTELREVQQKAKKKKRGVWNEKLYRPAPPKLHARNILVGLGNSKDSEGFYREIVYVSEPLGNSNGLGFRVMCVFGRQAREYEGYRDALLFLAFYPFYSFNGRYFGFRIGNILIMPNNPEVPVYFASPNGQIKIGLLHKAYLSIDILTDLVYSPASIGINFLREKPYRKLWIGITPGIMDRTNIAFMLEFSINNKILIKLHGIYFRYLPEDGTNIAENNFGLRLGLGYILH